MNSKNPNSDSHSQSDYESKIASLRHDYQKKLPVKIQQIEQLWEKLNYFNWSEKALGVLHNLVHSLAGSGKTFGFSDLSINASELDQYFQANINSAKHLNAAQRQTISDLIKDIKIASQNPDLLQKREQKIPEFSELQRTNHKNTKIFLVDDDIYSSEYLGEQLIQVGYQVTTFSQINSMRQQLELDTPDVVIMDIMFPEGSLAGVDAIEQIRAQTGKRTPVLFMSARTDVTARLRVARAGGDAYFTKPVQFDSLLNKLEQISLPGNIQNYRVLIVDDDVELGQHYATILQQAGMCCEIISNPMQVIQELMVFKPDILILDVNMPNVNGIDLARMVYQDERFLSLPVVFVSAETDPIVQASARSLAGSEFISKPVENSQLIDVVSRSVVSSRRVQSKIKQISRKDPSSGLTHRKSFLVELEKAVAINEQASDLRVLLYIMVNHFDAIRSQVGIAGLDELSSQLSARILLPLNKARHVSQLSEAIFAVLIDASDDTSIMQLCDLISNSVSSQSISINQHQLEIQCSIGVAKVSKATSNVQFILSQAEKAATKAMEKGRTQFSLIDGGQPQKEQVNEKAQLQKIIEALKNKSFHLVFQPILNIEDKAQELYETQLRLIDENDKTLLPEQFYPIAKEQDLLYDLDRWSIEQSINLLENNTRIRNKGNFLIKISGESISRGSFLVWLSNCLSSSHLRGEQKIIFEIAEDDVVTRIKEMKKFSEGIKSLSCGLAIDNFGQSKASLKLLDEIDVSYVKVNGNKINQLSENDALRNEFKELIETLQIKGKYVIVDSIDNPMTMAMLWEWGVRYFQGYYIEEANESLNFDFDSAVGSIFNR